MKKKKLLQTFLALFCCFALLLSGCSQNAGTAENENADANREQQVEEVELIPITIGEVAHSVLSGTTCDMSLNKQFVYLVEYTFSNNKLQHQ